ncbi:MAG: hypothetical protein LAO09_22630, partial [Acidobacteriia bacterium]|nr:hypothetical protein [Terriglobia bacterium]
VPAGLGATYRREMGRGKRRRSPLLHPKFSDKGTSVRADQRPSYLPGDKFAVVVRELAHKKDDKGNVVYPELEKTVTGLLNGEKGDDEIKVLQVWYDQVMERVSGWYKRHAQLWVKVLAIIVVVVLNADTLQIASLLWTDPTVRQVAVEQARVRLNQPPPEAAVVEYSDSDETLPDEVPEQVGTPGDSSDNHLGLTGEQWQVIHQLMSWDEDRAVLEQDLQSLQASKADAPLAQETAKAEGKPVPQEQGGSEMGVYIAWVGYLLRRHLLGWFVSIVAVSLGAPFWFDALNRLVNIRNAGNVPAKKEEGAGDKDAEKKQ